MIDGKFLVYTDEDEEVNYYHIFHLFLTGNHPSSLVLKNVYFLALLECGLEVMKTK